ncbi:hypothetical protein M3Y97_00313400 [Aphelenchoides bicaudatus]|nr:hypothetical protein M3Y97_00313400 [Aphelenchoides bicaudatus]
MAIYDTDTSSLNEDARRFNANRRSGITAQTVVKTIGKILMLAVLIIMAFYVITDVMAWRTSCKDQDQLHFAPLIERDGVLELSWDSLPTAIRSISNLLIFEYNSHCGGPFGVSQIKSLTCDQLTLGYMPHSNFHFRDVSDSTLQERASLAARQKVPCFGLRWITNRMDTFYGPFSDLDQLKRWFNASTSSEYNGCVGKPGRS